MSGEIHHGHQGAHAHGHGAWQANPLPGGVPSGAPGEAGPVRHGHAKGHQQTVDLQKDVQSSVQANETKSKDQAHNIASGFRYATLSQSQLDGADPTQPRVTDAKLRAATGSLPGGPSGTGNPFFRPNPMVTFFTAFMNLLQVMKWLQKVATKLTVIQMQGVKDTGLAQAQATLNAGKAQAAADRAQGIVSAIQAGFTGVQLVGSIARDVQISKAAAKSMKSEQNAAAKFEEDALDQKRTLTNERAGVNARARIVKNEPDIEVKGHVDRPGDSQQEKFRKRKEAASQARTKAEQEYQNAQTDFQKSLTKSKSEKVTEASKGREELVEKRKELRRAEQEYQQAADADEYHKLRYNVDGTPKNIDHAKLQRELDQGRFEVLHSQNRADKFDSEAEKHWEKAEEYDFKGTQLKAWQTRAQIKQNDKIWLSLQLGGQAINQILDTVKMFFKATGEEQSAYWQSYGQIMATYNQMIKTGLDSTVQMNRDAYQQGGDLSQTLIKMSDQESQSMHWAA